MWDDDPYPYRAFDDEWITVWVVAVNVNAGLTEEGEENPGLYINVNWSDDDGDGWEPNENPPGATYRGDKDDDGKDHDAGPWPQGQESLMRSGTPTGDPDNPTFPVPGRWLRHEDWNEAND